MTAPTDEQLVRDYVAGEDACFDQLVHRHAQELHQFLLRFTRNAVSAEDLVQETFLQVHSSAPSFDPNRRFKPWLFTIAANKARDHLRKKKRWREVPIDNTIAPNDDSSQRFVDLLASEDAQPHDTMSQDETNLAVKETVDQMPDKLCEVLILAYYHRVPYKDIAEIIGVPLGTVKSRLHAAVAEFGEIYRRTSKNHANPGEEGTY